MKRKTKHKPEHFVVLGVTIPANDPDALHDALRLIIFRALAHAAHVKTKGATPSETMEAEVRFALEALADLLPQVPTADLPGYLPGVLRLALCGARSMTIDELRSLEGDAATIH